jgi:hypothetical protein
MISEIVWMVGNLVGCGACSCVSFLQIVKTLFDLFFRREDISRVLLHHTMGACYHREKSSDEYGNLAVYKPACILHALCVRK